MTAEYATLRTFTRDPLRIPHTLSALAGFWGENANMSLGEIIENVGVALEQDPYNLEESVFIEYFKVNKTSTEKKPVNPGLMKVLACLESYWMKYPDLRLGQIVGNVKNELGKEHYSEVENKDVIASLSLTNAWDY